MVYKHRTQKGKTINFRNKGAYESWKRGMFANLQTNGSSKRKIAKAKSKSRKQMRHAGVGRVSSGRKKFCDTCRGEGKKLTEGKCKVCAKEFASFKQPENIENQEIWNAINEISNATGMTPLDLGDLFTTYDIRFEDLDNLEFTPIGNIGWEIKSNEGTLLLFKEKDDAKGYAIDQVRDEIEESPENFNESFLQTHITMTDADIRMNATQEAESRYDWDAFSDEDLKHRFGKGWDETKSREQLITDAKYNETIRIRKELEESPLAYYVTDTGFYTKSNLLDQDWIKIDAHEAAEEAVQLDGIAHYLAREDGEEYRTTNGYYAYRTT